jgi:hypothetical protein
MIKQRDSKVKKGEKANPQLGRKPYLKPKLIEYGQLEKLTQGATGTRDDVGTRRR